MKKGIDVSYCQGRIDFDRIDKNQVQFAIIRSSFGWEKNQKDSQFERNYAGFKKLGIPVGAYHYSYAKTKEQAVKEAKYCLECIRGKSFELPVFLDMEEQSCAAAGRRACTDVAKADWKEEQEAENISKDLEDVDIPIDDILQKYFADKKQDWDVLRKEFEELREIVKKGD